MVTGRLASYSCTARVTLLIQLAACRIEHQSSGWVHPGLTPASHGSGEGLDYRHIRGTHPSNTLKDAQQTQRAGFIAASELIKVKRAIVPSVRPPLPGRKPGKPGGFLNTWVVTST
jgi:hypothetical protein